MTELEKAIRLLNKAKNKLGDREVLMLIEDAIEELESLQETFENSEPVDILEELDEDFDIPF